MPLIITKIMQWLSAIEEWFQQPWTGSVVCDGGPDREVAVTTETDGG